MKPKLAGLIALVAVLAVLVAACSGGNDSPTGDGASDEGEALDASAEVLMPAAAEAIGAVSSVHFQLERTGAPVHIDPADLIAIEAVEGRWVAPDSADALLEVKINDSINTKLGAVSVDGLVYLSNPITGDFEPLPDGYDVDPTEFFDPVDGWRPLLLEMSDVELIGEDDRAGGTYHLRGTAPASRVENVTAGLVDDQDLELDLWIETDTALVRSVEFTNDHDLGTSSWRLDLDRYGEEMTIEIPENVSG
ncbi:MAG: LppX_LprAFG lipoprotein [Acidimicrobiales bacterium]|nr:LppX_LprAFG lipoprotein [Acidimicrobiales bacterium]